MVGKHISSEVFKPLIWGKGAYSSLFIFFVSVMISVTGNIFEWGALTSFFKVATWCSLLGYFVCSIVYVNIGLQGWNTRFFTILFFIVLFLFIGMALVMMIADAMYIDKSAFIKVLTSGFVFDALQLSVVTSAITVLIALCFAVPMGYVLSRFRFPGRIFVDTLVDIPIVFPPLVAGLTLLIFFSQTAFGQWVQEGMGIEFVFQPKGIVLCQFVVSASFAIRSIKSAFDDIDRRLEKVALTLGCTQWGSFFRVSLPMASGGIVAGAILTWARAFGIFGPLMIFVGSFRGRTEVLSTTIFLEQSVGNLEVALAVALLMIIIALVALVTIRLVGGKALVKI